MKGIKISLSIKKEILKYTFYDMKSDFYNDTNYDNIDTDYIYKELENILQHSNLPIFLVKNSLVTINIDSSCEYIEFEYTGTHEQRGYVTVGIIAKLNEGFEQFTDLYYIDKDGEYKIYSLDEL